VFYQRQKFVPAASHKTRFSRQAIMEIFFVKHVFFP
jgi:hypothetical protein